MEGLRLGRFGKEKIPTGVVVSGGIQDEEKLAGILRSLKKRESLNFVRVSLPEEQMYLFTLSLPKVNEKELKDIILLQIEEHIPLKAMDTIFDYEVISNKDNNIVVLVSAIAESTIASYLSVFNKAGLTVVSFELEAQAIARAVIPTEDKEPTMIVDFGDTRTGVSIVHDGRVFFTTTLDMGGATLTDTIAKNFSFSIEKAEEMKRSYGLGGLSNIDDIFPVILNGISVLKDELNKQYEYWKSHDDLGIKHGEIKRIILCGGDSNLTGLSDYLEASMKIKVSHANAWGNISEMKISIPSMSFEESLSYVTVLGLALGEFTYRDRVVVNVLPEEEKSSLKKEYWKRFSIVVVSLLTSVVFIFTLLLLPSYFFTASKESIMEAELDNFNANNKTLMSQDLNVAIVDINDKLTLLSSMGSSSSIYDDVLGIVLSNRPTGVTFSQILFNQKQNKGLVLEVYGKAINRTVLHDFKTFIDSNPRVASADLPIANFLEKNDLSFNMSIIIK